MGNTNHESWLQQYETAVDEADRRQRSCYGEITCLEVFETIHQPVVSISSPRRQDRHMGKTSMTQISSTHTSSTCRHKAPSMALVQGLGQTRAKAHIAPTFEDSVKHLGCLIPDILLI
jgi:hypothetical protein